jgi:hypothetical protein
MKPLVLREAAATKRKRRRRRAVVAPLAATGLALGLGVQPAAAAPYSHTETVVWNTGSCSVTHTWEETASDVRITISGQGGPCETPGELMLWISVDQVYDTGGMNGPFTAWDDLSGPGDELFAELTVLKHDEKFDPVSIEGGVEIQGHPDDWETPSYIASTGEGSVWWDLPPETTPNPK